MINNTIDVVFELALVLQSQVKIEKKFEFMHQMMDLRGRRVLDIIVANGFYRLLQNNDIGIIAENLWAGTNAKKLLKHSFVNKFVNEDFNEEVTDFSCPIQESKRWIFQFHNWKESCENRYIVESLSICCLAVFYQLVVYLSIRSNTLDDLSANPTVVPFMRLAQIWIISSILGEAL